ncbi:hypothetical protein J0X19_09805 [Hymenobacter sp. BT186]|uniref:Uncharacterized protein n=1 Tax=Hymenobacter telluris TaxID=2816474 RepID=A0A939EWC3_9BACT|nr:hypothetical protein [Hymenobacter telluris]MBO0358236.1 hypothetical protein [Hymenobacter telluris]
MPFTSCHLNSSRTNSEEDKQIAEEFLLDYFSNQQMDSTAANFRLFSKQFWQVSPREKMEKMVAKRNEILGRLKSTELGQWQTVVVSGSDPASKYVLQYKNKYEKGEAVETFTMRREGAHDSIRIIGYNINSDAFLR